MTPEEKALELFNKMYNVDCDDDTDGMQYGHAKKCALIAVDALINYSKEWDDSDYWQQVKQEIIKL